MQSHILWVGQEFDCIDQCAAAVFKKLFVIPMPISNYWLGSVYSSFFLNPLISLVDFKYNPGIHIDESMHSVGYRI